MMLKVSVVTPTLNAMEYLPKCIASVRAQASSRVRVEHVVVDAKSSDGSAAYAREQECTVLDSDDSGIFEAINNGSAAAGGTLLGFLGADDLLLPGALDTVARMYQTEGHRWLVGGIRWTDERGRTRGDLVPPPRWLTPSLHACLGWSYIHHMATYMHRSLFVELGGFDVDLRYSGDYEFFTRALEHEPFARVERILATFGRHGKNQSMAQNSRVKAENEWVLQRSGPPEQWRRHLYRYAMKTWVNARNPGWALRKPLTAFGSSGRS